MGDVFILYVMGYVKSLCFSDSKVVRAFLYFLCLIISQEEASFLLKAEQNRGAFFTSSKYLFPVSVLPGSEGRRDWPRSEGRAGALRPRRVRPPPPRRRPPCGERGPGASDGHPPAGRVCGGRVSPESWPCQSGADKGHQNTGYHGRLTNSTFLKTARRETQSASLNFKHNLR